MSRFLSVILILGGVAGCEDGKSKMSAAADKVGEVGKKVGGALDKLDVDEAKDKLSKAKDSIASGLEAAEECAWAARVGDEVLKEAAADPVKELRRVCSFEAPMGRATRAVARAEAAKAEQPQAPSLTECSSDDWASAKQKLEASPHAGEARWTELKARWTKVCP